MKFGYGDVAEVDGNKLTVDFDKAGAQARRRQLRRARLGRSGGRGGYGAS